MMKQTRINWENKIKYPIKGRLPGEVQPVVKSRVNTTTTLSEKKEEARNVSEQRDKGWIHVIHVHDTTH